MLQDTASVQGLLPCHLPAVDATRLTHLLASFGVTDLTYLHVLARMITRDQWLDELREQGQLTEIQMRVLREVLDTLVKT